MEPDSQTGTSAASERMQASDGAANEVIATSRDHAQQRGYIHQSLVGRFNSQPK
jgi:hypothetical protein